MAASFISRRDSALRKQPGRKSKVKLNIQHFILQSPPHFVERKPLWTPIMKLRYVSKYRWNQLWWLPLSTKPAAPNPPEEDTKTTKPSPEENRGPQSAKGVRSAWSQRPVILHWEHKKRLYVNSVSRHVKERRQEHPSDLAPRTTKEVLETWCEQQSSMNGRPRTAQQTSTLPMSKVPGTKAPHISVCTVFFWLNFWFVALSASQVPVYE